MTATPINNTCVLGTSLHSILERNPSTLGGKAHERFGITTKIHRSLDDVLADPELVIVATPSHTHYEIGQRIPESGKHTVTVEQARELGRLAKSQNLVTSPYQNAQWNSDFLALEKLLELPYSDSRSLVQFSMYMHYPVVTAILRAHILSVRSTRLRFLVLGTKGSYQGRRRRQESQPKTLGDPSTEIRAEGIPSWPSTDPGAYIDLSKNLASVIRDGAAPEINWEEATAVIEMVELAHQSSREGRTPDFPSHESQ
ncbi:hypothetical protein BDN71DRAFT_1504258 [Pleurotus eryngii]|uniref:Gfo/Idh/MocA-like oxidoreductase N-terminal domain-containing protein n=1 Tax=Pleurotus eryngii TaxID=5323 RepID=A0A9P6A1F5_PLEER|nr:hypothetical protein BDN71DRAFT_1504258 [Pleurotus eryngii]